MKKLLSLILLLLVSYTNAQEKGAIDFGAGIGANSSWIGSGNKKSEHRYGYNFSVFSDFYLSHNLSIKGKLTFESKGWEYDENNFLLPGESADEKLYTDNYNLQYVTVPVLLGYHIDLVPGLYVNAGPYAGFLVGANEASSNTNIKDGFNGVDYGFEFAFGLQVPIGQSLKIFVDISGQSGLNELFKDNAGDKVKINRGAATIGTYWRI